MKRFKIPHLLAGFTIVILIILSSVSCATTRQARIDTQKRGLMLQDKSQYTMNSKFKGGKKNYKTRKKRSRRNYKKKYR